jgi:hypothetical protein
MKIYLAGERSATAEGTRIELAGQDVAAIWTKHVKRRLFSFYYHGFSASKTIIGETGLSLDIERGVQTGLDLFLDSGAYTAFTKKTPIPLREYAEYVRRHKAIWTTCSSLDAIGSGEAAAKRSYDNLKELEKYGAKVQPVFHVREPDRWLQRYIDEGYDYIFIGGMVPETTRWLMVRLDQLWGDILTNPDGTAKVRTHGFGLTDQQLMFRYPWHSVDSTSWLMTGIFGACMFRNGRKLSKVVFSEESPQARKWKGWHYKNLPDPQRDVVDGWIKPYGVTPEQLGSHYSYRDVVNAAVFQGLEDMGATHFHPPQQMLFPVVDDTPPPVYVERPMSTYTLDEDIPF